MKVINLFGGPNSGKSATAAGLFYVMKIKGYDIELASEYAKDLVYEQRHNVLSDQLYILAKQNRKLERLRNISWAVTDSPLILGTVYAKSDYYHHFKDVALDIWDNYDNLNFYLTSEKPLPFQDTGRIHNQNEAKIVNSKIYQLLLDHNIQFETINVVPDVVDPFQNHISEILKFIA